MIKEREKNSNRSKVIIDKNINSHCHSKKISRRKIKKTARIRFQALNNLDNLKNFSKGPILRSLIATRRMMVSSLTILQNQIMSSD